MNKVLAKRARARRTSLPVRLEPLESRQLLASFTVTNVSDTGPGSLRQAIIDSNAAPGATNTISFAIPGPGVHTITPASQIDAIQNPVVLDATTQPGYAGTPLIELDGADIPSTTPADGLIVGGGSSVIKGLTIDRFAGYAIRLTRDGNTVAANYLGTDPTGTLPLGNGTGGVAVLSRNDVIGGPDAASANLISANGGPGIILFVSSTQPANNVVERNLIGTDVTGTRDLGNVGAGVLVDSSSNVIGGSIPSLGNTIAFNGGAGVQVGLSPFDVVAQDRIAGNSIFSNVGLGIDLGNDGVTFNHPGAGSGPNNLQNYPILTSAYVAGAGTTIEGTLDAAPITSYSVEFDSSPIAGPTGFGQGKTFLGTEVVLTDANGHADVTSTFTASVPPGQVVSATATDGSGNTSEFARSVAVTATAQSDLVLQSLSPNPTPQAGVAQSYTFQVMNKGPAKATNVVAIDTLPAGATFQFGNSSQGSLVPSNGVVTINLGSLASGASAQFTLNYSVAASGPALNTVSVKADQADPNPSDDTLTQNFFVGPGPVPAVDLSLFGSASPFSVQVGDTLTYTFVVNNLSFSRPGTGVTLTDTLPEGVTYVSSLASQGSTTFAGGVVTANLNTLNPFFNAVVTIVVTPTVPGSLTNTATVKGNEADPDSLNNMASVTTFVSPAPATDLAVIVTAAPQTPAVGNSYTYAVLVGNPGTANATDVTLFDVLPDAAAIVSIRPSQGTSNQVGRTLTVALGSLAPGAMAQVTIVVVPGAPGVLLDQAAVSGDQPDDNIADNYSVLSTIVQADVTAPSVTYSKLTVAHNAISNVVLTFDKDLDPTLAADPANYQILDLGGNGSASASGPKVALASVTYNPITRNVTLTPARGLSIGRFYKLVVNGEGAPGVTDKVGNVLDGVGNGLQNSIYTAIIGRGTKNRPVAVQTNVQSPIPPSAHSSSKAKSVKVAKARSVPVKAAAVPVNAAAVPVQAVAVPVETASKKKKA
jgi:uncharacterized repeat protein (TIGR01451 family)